MTITRVKSRVVAAVKIYLLMNSITSILYNYNAEEFEYHSKYSRLLNTTLQIIIMYRDIPILYITIFFYYFLL